MVDIKHGELKDIEKKEYDIIVVNIIADVIISLLPDLKHTAAIRQISYCQVLFRQARGSLSSSKEQGYDLVSVQSMGEWVAMQICTGF